MSNDSEKPGRLGGYGRIALMKLLPRVTMSRAAGFLADRRRPRMLVRAAIAAFVRRYRIDLSEAEVPPGGFRSFNELFVRRLKPGVRPIDEASEAVVSPVDGRVAGRGVVEQGRMWQAKGLHYGLEELLPRPELAERFRGGSYLTLYLSPRHYHRIHAPLAGRVVEWEHQPGTLYPVNEPVAHYLSRLFARNERLTSVLATRAGRVAVVKVGATVVGRIRLAYDEVEAHPREVRHRSYPADEGPQLAKGEELGRFELGSTVILLFESGRLELEPLEDGQEVRMGQRIGAVVRRPLVEE